MKVWAWIALELRHVPDFLEGVELLNGSLQALPLDDKSKRRVQEDLRELDAAFGAVILNLLKPDLARLSSFPDILDGLGLFMSRTALLYAIGHEAVLREDGSLPASESDLDVREFLSLVASQPVADEARYALNLNESARHCLSVEIMGMSVEVEFDGTDNQTQVTEVVLGSIEAFFATAIEKRISPHTERFRIKIVDSEGGEPEFTVDPLRPSSILRWPPTLEPGSFDQNDLVRKSLATLCGLVLAATCMVANAETQLEELFSDEAVHQRLAMVQAALNSYHRMNRRSVSRLENWQRESHQTYQLKDPLPEIPRVDLTAKRPQNDVAFEEKDGKPDKGPKRPAINDHRSLRILSVIDLHAWDKAAWRGTAFPVFAEPSPAILAFLFENREGAEAIFTRWQERFGAVDPDDDISISIVRHLHQQPQSHYCVVITASRPCAVPSPEGQMYILPSRSMTMEPADSVNLDGILKRLTNDRKYFVLPAILNAAGGPPELLMKLAIRKTALCVREASEIQENDINSIALQEKGVTLTAVQNDAAGVNGGRPPCDVDPNSTADRMLAVFGRP